MEVLEGAKFSRYYVSAKFKTVNIYVVQAGTPTTKFYAHENVSAIQYKMFVMFGKEVMPNSLARDKQ